MRDSQETLDGGKYRGHQRGLRDLKPSKPRHGEEKIEVAGYSLDTSY